MAWKLFEDIRSKIISALGSLDEVDRAISVNTLAHQAMKQIRGDGNGESGAISGGGPDGNDAYLTDMFTDSSNQLFVVYTQSGHLFQVSASLNDKDEVVLGTPTEIDFAAIDGKARSTISIKRTADGKSRWFAFPACTAVINRDSQIDSTKLFDSFVEHVDRTHEYPVLTFWHQSEKIKLGQADYVARDGYTLLLSGLCDETREGKATAASLQAHPEYWGTSIGYKAMTTPILIEPIKGILVPVYEKGILREISLCPERMASSLFTACPTMEVNRMNKAVSEALEVLTGEDKELLAQLTERIDGTNRTIEEEDLLRRTTDEQPADSTAEVERRFTKKKATDTQDSTDPNAGAADPNATQADATQPAPATPAATPPKPAKQIDITPDDLDALVTAVLGNQTFTDAINTMISDQVTTMLNQSDQQQQAAATAQSAQTAQASQADQQARVSMQAQIDELMTRLERFEQVEGIKEDDLPAKAVTRVTYRARTKVVESPDEVTDDIPLSERAQSVLSKMPPVRRASGH